MNERLPTNDNEAYFWAEPSRTLIAAIDTVETLQWGLKKSKYAFEVAKYYQMLFTKCNTFLRQSNGSTIPPHMAKIELYYTLPIFLPLESINIENSGVISTSDLKLIGEGSYVYVYRYEDPFYNKTFILKRAKPDLNEKELIRFKQEFESMKSLVSPYIVDVYRYEDERKQYIMEYMDYSLYDYIEKNNTTLTKDKRKNVGFQILRSFSYIHTKNLLHRDISPKNILIKEYDDVLVVKVSDFGLVRIPHSDLTSANTEVKGCFNDPNLLLEGFSNYDTIHETYALTRLLAYIMTGKTNTDKIKDESLKVFVSKGLHPDKAKRFKSVSEISDAFKAL